MNNENIDLNKQISVIEKSYKFFKKELKEHKNDLNLLVGEVFALKDLTTLFIKKLEDNDFEDLNKTSFFKDKVSEVVLIEKIKSLKLKTTLMFENLINLYPDFSLSYYHLGFIFLNEGKYQKAKLYFNDFLLKSNDDKYFSNGEHSMEMIEEVVTLTSELDIHVQVEKAINFLENSIHNYEIYKKTNSETKIKRIKNEKDVLIKYKDDERYQNYWPLKFFLFYNPFLFHF